MIKKMMMLSASMALAAIVLTAPAAAQEKTFWTQLGTGTTVGDFKNSEEISAEGPITSVVGSLKTTANISLGGLVWNEGDMGEGEITEKSAGVGTVAGVPGFLDCTVNVTLLTHEYTFTEPFHFVAVVSWALTLTTDFHSGAGTESATLDIENVTFLNHYNAGCQAAGIPATAGAEGTVRATLANGPEEDMTLTFEGGSLTLTGSAGTIPVTLESEPITVNGVQVEQP